MVAPFITTHDVAMGRASVSGVHRQRLAWVAAIVLHVIALGVMGGWRLAPEPTPPMPVSLDVVLTGVPSTEPQSVPEPLPDPSPQAPSEPVSPPQPETPPVSEAPEPELESAPQPEPPPASASPSPPPQAAESPSGRALLAEATASVSQQGFDASQAGGAGDASQSAAQRAAESRYIDAWTRRVEEYGNRFYPAPDALDGQLRIRVIIGRDGQLRLAEVIQSSGHPELDRAALKTVRGAAPYRPFDSGMGARDSLAITRVWRFGEGNNFGVQ